MRYIRRVIVIAFVAVAAVYLVTTIAVSRKQDKTAPVITCEVDELEVTILDKIQASDAIDGNINEKIKIISSNVNVAKEGTYSIGVEVVNDYADVVSLELPVHIIDIDDNAPSIQLDTYLSLIDGERRISDPDE